MSVTLYISLQRPIKGVKPNAGDRVLILLAERELKVAARKLKVRPLEDFFSYDLSDISGLLDNGGERKLTGPPVQWFEPEEGLRTIQALLRYVEQNAPVMLDGEDRTKDMLDELRDCEAVLARAARSGVKFRMHPGD